MDEKHSNVLNSFKIPIEQYEKDIDEGSMKGNKQEILDILTNYNKLGSLDEYTDIAYYLHEACKAGDTELIKVLVSEVIQNDNKDFKFKIDKTKQTASLFKISGNAKKIVIPRTVRHESIEYLITSVCSIRNYDIERIEFVEESEVKTIHQNALLTSKIKEIYLPASLKELKEGWCQQTENLIKIDISSSNDRFILKNNKVLLGKSDENSDEFDVFLFASRDVREITISSNIKIISSYACQYCNKLSDFEIPTNSKLQTIGSFAFSRSKIREIYFPATLKELKKGWCYYTRITKIIIHSSNNRFKFKRDKYLVARNEENNNNEFDNLVFVRGDIEYFSIPSNIKVISAYAFSNCENLTKVRFSLFTNLQIIESYAFAYTNIKEISIPSKVSKIYENAFADCSYLTKVEIPKNSNLQTIGARAFYRTKINEIFIPPKVSEISNFTFYLCRNFQKIEISTNSNLQVIEPFAFADSGLKEIFIPSKVLKICECAFWSCLKKIIIPTNSNLQTIEARAFEFSGIEEIYFPASLNDLKEGWCQGICKLKKIIVSPMNKKFIFKEDKYLIGKSDEKVDEYDNLLFASRAIEEISIPSNIKIISSHAFANCNHLKKVEIQKNSNLQTIGAKAFYNTIIEKIFIPPKTFKICGDAFYDCKKLEKVEFSTNSNLQIIEQETFKFLNIKEIFIPSTVLKICKCAFYYCNNLTKVEIPINSNLQIIESNAFAKTNIINFVIPSKVSKIYQKAFKGCSNLLIVEISEESKLESFPLSAFPQNRNLIIMIPSSLKKFFQ